MHPVFVAPGGATVPIRFVTGETWSEVRAGLDERTRAFVDAAGFEPKPGRHLALPGEDGLGGILFGLEPRDERRNPFLPGLLPGLLPDGSYRFANAPHDLRLGALAFALGAYRFARYRRADKHVRLEVPGGSRCCRPFARCRGRHPRARPDQHPGQRSRPGGTRRRRTCACGAPWRDFSFDHRRRPVERELSAHPCGRPRGGARAAAHRLHLGRCRHPKVTLVGKGVCFDSGGLDIKPESAMLIMKKDMGGAASALALAHMVMDRGLKVRLRVFDPGRGEFDLGQRLPSARRLSLAQGIECRDRQHRCGRPPHPGRCACARRRRGAGTPARHGYADRRGPGRARPRSAAVLYRRRRAGRRGRALRRGRARPALAAAAVAAL